MLKSYDFNELLIQAELEAGRYVTVCQLCGFMNSFHGAPAATDAADRHQRATGHDPVVESPPGGGGNKAL